MYNALAVDFFELSFNLLELLFPHQVHKAHDNFVGKYYLFEEYFFSFDFRPFAGRHHRNDRMQLPVDFHLFVEPKLFDRGCWVCQAVGLNNDIANLSVVDDVLDGCNQIIP